MVMLQDEKIIQLKELLVKPGSKVKLKNYATKYKGKILSKSNSELLLESGRKHLAEVQDKLYAHNKYSVLIIFQAMDAAGKDGAVKHIMSGFNPLGVNVYSFKAPNATELDHDYFWRHMQALPARGDIAIHNRSHYENVLATKVHPEWILNENIPEVSSLDDVNSDFWKHRYKQIKRFEKTLAANGMVIMKFFLHVSKEEQKRRFLERIDNPAKNWKFSPSDLKERRYWDDYQNAYENAISATSTADAPWYIIPADNKWYSRLAIAGVITRHFAKLSLSYPQVSDAQKIELEKARGQLMAENGAQPVASPKKRRKTPTKK